jgi:hypothetical protein
MGVQLFADESPVLADAGRRDDTTARKATQGFRREAEVLSGLRDTENHFAVAVCVILRKSPRASFHRCHSMRQSSDRVCQSICPVCDDTRTERESEYRTPVLISRSI